METKETVLCLSFQLHRLVFSLRHSKEERKDLDWEQEEKGRRARREAKERAREKNMATGKQEKNSNLQRQLKKTSWHKIFLSFSV